QAAGRATRGLSGVQGQIRLAAELRGQCRAKLHPLPPGARGRAAVLSRSGQAAARGRALSLSAAESRRADDERLGGGRSQERRRWFAGGDGRIRTGRPDRVARRRAAVVDRRSSVGAASGRIFRCAARGCRARRQGDGTDAGSAERMAGEIGSVLAADELGFAPHGLRRHSLRSAFGRRSPRNEHSRRRLGFARQARRRIWRACRRQAGRLSQGRRAGGVRRFAGPANGDRDHGARLERAEARRQDACESLARRQGDFAGNAGAIMDRYKPPGRMTLWLRFFGGIVWFGFLAWLVSMSTRTPFRAVFVVVSGGEILTACLALAWLTLWAERRNSVAGQFTIGSLLFATCFAAIFFAAVRWIGAALDHAHHSPSGGGWLFLPVAFAVAFA